MGITHSWNGTVLTITSDSGTSSADLKGDTGIRGPQGAAGIINDIALNNYYKKEETDAAIANAIGDIDFSGYYTKSETDTAINNAKPDLTPYAKITEVNTAVSKAAPRNLLDNSYFLKPINQRGFTSGKLDSNYTIDRWLVNSANNAAIVSINSSGMVLNKNGNEYVGIYQLFENYSSMAGKKYTAVVCINNVPECVVFTMGQASSAIQFPSKKCSLYSVQSMPFLIRNTLSTSLTIQYTALYEGEYTANTLPEYQYKGYAAELAECQRYYYQSWDGATISTTGLILKRALAANRLMTVDFPVTMRITPTIRVFTTEGVEGKVKEWVTDSIISTTNNIHAAYQSTQRFTPSIASGLEIEKEYYFHYSASADL